MRTSSKIVSASVLTVALAGAVAGSRIGQGGVIAAAASPPRVGSLEVFHGSPVLVRAGEDVRIPVDVVCATQMGTPCEAQATLKVQERGTPAGRPAVARAAPGVAFDVSAPATRAVAGQR